LADAEAGSASGGLPDVAKRHYMKYSLAETDDQCWPALSQMLTSKCVFGLCALSLQTATTGSQVDLERSIQARLAVMEQMKSELVDGPLYVWKEVDATMLSVQYHLAAGRQLLADVFLRNDRAFDAQNFLEQAVKDSPNDPMALLSLGAFHLRMLFFADKNGTSDRTKLAQAYLLRAAKADPTRASPFALLGYWYEHAGDNARATGCYAKALLIDPSHPVAGRGLIRLKSLDSLKPIIENATAEMSPLNGWAWYALGLDKKSEGNDDLVIISFVTALRCRDIIRPDSDHLSYFYSNPHQPCPPSLGEFVAASTELAGCYRRAGRYTASIRCYEAAIKAAGESISSSILCCCAQGKLYVVTPI
jgi:tetratricopeptide (TPR) repeat protein